MSEGYYYTFSDSEPEVLTKPDGYKNTHGTGYQKTIPEYFFYLKDLEADKDKQKTIKLDLSGSHQPIQKTQDQSSSSENLKS